jgi:predicted nucleic-acid-binding protein
MLAIDTNLIVRYLTGDHPSQSARARILIDGNDVYVGSTVLLETAWVLRGAYGYSAQQLCAALRAFCGLPSVILEDAAVAAEAFAWVGGGMEFADALHLAGAAACEQFVTFDKIFVETANKLSVAKVRSP